MPSSMPTRTCESRKSWRKVIKDLNLTRLFIYRDVDKVHDMMDDIAEQQDVAREISDAISNPVAFGADLDDEDLERELDELEQENFDKEIIGIPEPAPTLPEAPTEDLPEKAKEKKKAAPATTTAADDGEF